MGLAFFGKFSALTLGPVRRPRPDRWLALVAATSVLLAGPSVTPTGISFGPEPVKAVDCDNTHAYRFAFGSMGVTSARGLRADIAWTNPTVCDISSGGTQFSLEGMMICNTACNGWIEVGWWKTTDLTSPKMMCEFAPAGPGRVIKQFSITSAVHEYKAHSFYDGIGWVWACSLDGVEKWGYTAEYMGFSSSPFVLAQGETNSLFSQIGKIHPSKLLYSNMEYYRSGVCWCSVNVTLGDVSPKYGRDEPAVGQFRNWTNE